MASEIPSASWHPAMMPNSHVESPETHHVLEQGEQEAELETAADPVQIAESGEDTSNLENPRDATTIEQHANMNEGAFLDQFAEDDPEAGGWDLEDPEAAAGPVSHDSPIAEPEAAIVDHTPASVPEPAAQPNTTKHLSTASFARTVSHDVNWNDDEDAEWNLQRTDTDPFQFMPANERTNSFPAVPPAEPYADSFLETPQSPPPASQAQEIMQELEHEAQQSEAAEQQDFMQTFEDGATQVEPEQASFPVGGDMIGAEEAADDARFEEGLPLIPHDEPEVGADLNVPSSSSLDAAFGDEAGGDDFFSQIKGDTTQESAEADFGPTLHRKDTSMFTNAAIGTNSFGPETPALAEDDEFDIEPQNTPSDDLADNVNPASITADEPKAAEPVELDAKWAAAFGDDDDDFLLEDSATEEKELDPAAFLGSDDEGFLEDDDTEIPSMPAATPAASTAATHPSSSSRYAPPAQPLHQQPLLNTFNSMPNVLLAQQALAPQYGGLAQSSAAYGALPSAKPDISRAQSFADKSKGGYASPYDLPMDVVRMPKPRSSMQQLPRSNLGPPAPPSGPARSTSMYTQAPPLAQAPPPAPRAVAAIPSPPSSSSSNQPAPGLKPAPKLTSKSSFFEDLPLASKPRPASRQNSLPSPQGPPYAQSSQGPPMGSPQAPSVASPPQPSPAIAGLVAPEKVSPFAPLQNGPTRPSAPTTNRYSPAPAQGSASSAVSPPVAAAASRYSPAPPSRSNSGAYTAAGPAFQPRTSSPLAHFEASPGQAQNKSATAAGSQVPSLSRNASSQYEPRLTRVPSLPPTREVDEESPAGLMQSPPTIPPASRYSPQQARRTPPPAAALSASTLSPPKRAVSNYSPVSYSALPAKEVNFAPPPRSQTQSPGALHGRVPVKLAEAAPRPSSAHGPMSPRQTSSTQASQPPVTRTRGMSQVLNLVPPTDGRELDPLQRWRGAPIVSWGIGGAVITSFPKDIPRYGMNQALPMILRSPGEVKLQHIKDLQPLEERLTKFPGPLKGKSKKKEVLAWLTQGIELLEHGIPNVAFQQFVTHEDNRAIERALLWKILRVLIENDGALEGNPNVERAVRQVLSPELETEGDASSAPAVTMADLQNSSGTGTLQTDAVDSSAIEQLRKHLLLGDREKAAWAAVDRRLWGHAMLISSTVQGDLYKQVTQEFIKKEVNHTGGSNGSLAALYGVLSGNHEESVDALVPSHARAGLQLISTSVASAQSADALSGLDKWRETLGLILSNRSNNDVVAITSLGNLLSSYGRAEAAHICFLFARKHAVFGGLDDPNANFVLVGADHRRQADQFAKETEALLLSEVYEYGMALSGSNAQQSCPHLAAYKLQHATTLAEYGSRDKALAYCEAIMTAITAQTKRSPYYHPALQSAVDDLMGRLKLTPREGGGSWISKPTMNQVSNSMWDKFNKFVSGDDAQNNGQASPGEPGNESGPFARIAGGTPTISRSPSVNNFETFGGPSPAIATTAAASRYAPGNSQRTASYDPSSSYAPRTSMERSSGEYHRASLDIPRPSQESVSPMYGGLYGGGSDSGSAFGYQPTAPSQGQYAPNAPTAATSMAPPPTVASQSPYQPTTVPEPPTRAYSPHQPAGAQNLPTPIESQVPDFKPEVAVNDFSDTNGYHAPSYGGYEPPSMNNFDETMAEEPSITNDAEQPTGETNSSSGWEAPSYQPYSYEPPTASYEPDAEGGDADEDKPKPKKKSFMDDDDDDYVAAKPTAPTASNGKSKTEKDRENEEMFRKIAEEEAKRAAEAKSQKKGWLGGWFGGGGAKKEGEMPAGNKPIRAKLGESSSFVYDPNQKRWVNKKAGAEDTAVKSATPPPPRAAGTPPPPGPSSSAPPMGAGTPAPPGGGPPMGMPRSVSNLSRMQSMDNLKPPGPALGGMPPMARSASNMSTMSSISADSDGPPTLAAPIRPSGPPSRPSTSLSNASSIDDLLGAAGSRKTGPKKPRKSGRYVDVMAK